MPPLDSWRRRRRNRNDAGAARAGLGRELALKIIAASGLVSPDNQSMITTSSIRVQRTSTILRPDQSRVLLRPFRHEDPERSRRIIARIMSLPEKQVGPLLNEVSAEFSQRHQQIHRSFLERFEQVRDLVMTDKGISEQRQLLIGSYFVCEYSLESAATL
jgi:hypothetical protein